MEEKTVLRTKNVCTEIVAHNLCIGCGLCAGICPHHNLRIEFNKFGEYVAIEKGTKCPDTCNMCLEVCPFYNDKDNEDTLGKKLFAETPGIKHAPETGYFLKAFVGYSNISGHRENGASGGLATWMLQTLLKEKLVDQVACVGPIKRPERLFEFTICDSPEEIHLCSKSKYYPVEASEVVRHILANEGRYAVTVLPCFAKAFRLVMHIRPKLQQRIKFLLGLTCGQGKSKCFTEYACALGGGNPHNVSNIEFRVKNSKRPASEYAVRFVSGLGTECEFRGLVKMWDLGFGRRYFTPNACNFCTDTFSELADATFMDAWLHKYSKDYRGHNIVIARNKTLCNLIEQGGGDGQLPVQDLSIDRVIESQRGLVHSKRNFTPERCRLAVQAGHKVPNIRSALLSGKVPYSERLLAKATWLISLKSREEWIRNDKDLRRFQKAMLPYAAALVRAKLINRLQQRPWTLLGVLWRRFVRHWKQSRVGKVLR